MVRRRAGDLDDEDVAGARALDPGQVDEPVVAGPSGHPVGAVLAPLALGDHELDAAADQALVLLPGDLVDERDEPLVALLHHRLGHLVAEDGGGGARSL